jgi:hypothetical protein
MRATNTAKSATGTLMAIAIFVDVVPLFTVEGEFLLPDEASGFSVSRSKI